MDKLKVYLENERMLVFEDGKNKQGISVKPDVTFDGDSVIIHFENYGKYNKCKHYADIEVDGVVYESAVETAAAIAELCVGFSSGCGTSSPSLQEHSVIETISVNEEVLPITNKRVNIVMDKETIVEDLIANTKTLVPSANTFYKFGELTSLILQNIPDSILPVVIWFWSGSTPTSLVYPLETPILENSATIQPNSRYELSLLNGIISLSKIEQNLT